MKRHIVLVTEAEIKGLFSGQVNTLVRFFKKKPEFINQLQLGDLVFLRRKGEVLGQFEVGKMIWFENVEVSDSSLLGQLNIPLANKYALIIQINKLEQLITSPIEVNKKSRKEWEVLEN